MRDGGVWRVGANLFWGEGGSIIEDGNGGERRGVNEEFMR